jgi:hypothetical protein
MIKPEAVTQEKERRRAKEEIIKRPTKQQTRHLTPPPDNNRQKHVFKRLPGEIQENNKHNKLYFYKILFKQNLRNNNFEILILHLGISCN